MTGDGFQETTEEILSPLIFNCVKLLKARSSRSPEKENKLENFRYYVNDVIVHLQFFYSVDVYLYDYLKECSKILGKPTLNFLKAWKNSSSIPVDIDIIRCPVELDLISWITNGGSNSRSAKEVIHLGSLNLLKLYSLFRIAVAYLIKKCIERELSESEALKFSEILSLFLSNPTEEDRGNIDLISYDLKNVAVYQRNCLNCLFQNKHLLERFDVFKERHTEGYHMTAVILKVLMKQGIIQNASVKRALTEPWKCRLLKQLKSKLKKNKSVDGFDNLERVLDFFDYDHVDVSEMVELFIAVPELDLFMNGDSLSVWALILTKFIKLQCQKEELTDAIVKKLCIIMKYLSERCRSDLDEMTSCLVYLLRKHPRHLLIIGNEFLDVILLNINPTPTAITLGKLILNDPIKVQHFLEFLSDKLETLKKPQWAFSLLSILIMNEDSLPEIFTSGRARSVWKVSEISPKNSADLYNVLKAVYQKFEKNILEALAGSRENVLGTLDFTRMLVRLFLDKTKIKKMKKRIVRGKFEPLLMYEAVKKFSVEAVIESYLQGLLTIFCRMIRNQEEVSWDVYSYIASDIIKLNKESTWQVVVNSSEWKEFAKLTIGHCFSAIKDPSLMKILRLLVTAFYKSKEESKDCALIFQMVIAHSQFLKVMLGDSSLKSESVELFRCLIERSASEISLKHFPILLASYNASLSSSDITLLEILKFYENSQIRISDYEPFVWGSTAVSHYSVGKSPGLSLWQHFNMGNVMNLLDGPRMELSLSEFPIRRSLEEKQINKTVDDESVYDPVFLLPLFVNLLSPGAVVFCLSFIYKGGLAYTVRALSSECKDVRLLAAVVLSRFYNHLELSQNMKQKLVWMHFINCFRYGIKDLSAEPLPNVTTLFFSRMTLELSSHPAEMYSPLQNFLLAKTYFAFDRIPEFLPLFHSSEVSYRKHRLWLLEVLRDGIKAGLDMNTVFHSMALKVIFSCFHSQLCDVEMKKLILQVVERMLRVDKPMLLISEYGLLSWINSLEWESCQPILHDLLELLFTLTGVLVKDIKFNKKKHSNQTHLIQILNMLVRLLPSLRCLKSAEAFRIFLKIIKECLLSLVKNGKSDWFKLNKNKLFDIADVATFILGEEYDCIKFSKLPFYFRSFNDECCLDIEEDIKNSAFLFGILVNGEANGKNKIVD